MTVIVRRAGPDDAIELEALAAITFPLAAPDDAAPAGIAEFLRTTLSSARFAEYVVDATRVVLVAEQDAELVGYAMLVSGDPSDPDVAAAVRGRPTIDLNKFYVHPDRHGSGIAATLMDAAVDAARAARASSVWLGVNNENGRAARFYEKQGFVPVGTKRFLLGDRYEDDFVLERPL